eukprot:COSAG06_NODE_57227_length_281_cov_0.692308_1_plen_25_part_10
MLTLACLGNLFAVFAEVRAVFALFM